MSIICSCNLLTDHMIKEYLATNKVEKPSVEMIFNAFERSTVCAACARSIKCEIRKHMENICLEVEKSIPAAASQQVLATKREKLSITEDIDII